MRTAGGQDCTNHKGTTDKCLPSFTPGKSSVTKAGGRKNGDDDDDNNNHNNKASKT